MRLPWHRHDHRELTRATHCLNCGTRVEGLNYCPTCGQENFDYRTSLGHLVHFWWDRNVSVDGKLLRTLGVLLRQPGALTVAYLSGQRARYTPPLQLYFLTGLLYFFLLGWLLDRELQISDTTEVKAAVRVGRATAEAEADTVAAAADTVAAVTTVAADAAAAQTTGGAKADSSIGLQIGPNAQGKPAVYADLSDVPVADSLRSLSRDTVGLRIVRLGGWRQAPAELREAFMRQSAIGAIERVLKRQIEGLTLVSLPLFALALYLFYRRRHPFFFDHLVAATHFYSFSFLLTVPLFVIDEDSVSGFLWVVVMVYLVVYLLVSIRVVYRPSWLATVWHASVLIFYSFILFTLLLVAAWLGNVAADWAVLRWMPQLWASYAR